MRVLSRALCMSLATLSLVPSVFAVEWSMFRGPNGSGLSSKLNVPDDLSLAHVAWKIEPGRGGSSLIARGDKMFFTTHDDTKRSLICIDAKTGKELWVQSLEKLRKETATPPNDPAICTPVCDDTSVCAFFPDAGMIVTNLEGQVRWQKDLGPFYSMHGISASPMIAQGKVVVAVDQLQSPYIVALDLKAGDEVWKTERLIGVTGGYSTPVQMKLNDVDLIVSACPGELVGYDLATGEKRFSCTGVTNAPVGLPLISGNRIYYCEPPGEAVPMEALGPVDKNKDGVIELEEVKNSVGTYRLIERIDKGFGNGDGKVDQAEWDRGFGSFLNNGGLSCIELVQNNGVIESKVAWKYTKSTPYIPSLMLTEDKVYMVNDGGILIGFNAANGEVLKRTRLGEATGQYYASPISDGSRLVLANLEGKLSLVKAGTEMKSLATIDLEERVVATPTIHQGRLYVRTESQIYCFEGK
jgi:outer membrane protein assembly factor BamB